jgi:hypothetical protein
LKQFFVVRMQVAVVLILVLLASFAVAQSTNGTIAGVVTDNTGAVVSGASVSATGVASGETRTAVTGTSGEYRIESLTPGPYVITVKASGFAHTKIEGVVVRTSTITSNNVSLQVATTNEEVTVAASADTIQTESGELSKTISTTAIQDLPYGSQNPYSLAVTLPGVTTVASRDSFTNGSGFSVNGLRPRSNNFLLDGFDNNDNGISGQAFQPTNTESVQEVTILTNSYAAEFGRGGGSVSNLSFRSGGNTLHGAAWEQYSGAGLDALTSQDSALNGLTRVPQYVNNVFGFRLGGPIKKDKLYYFGTSQWSRFFGDPGASTLRVPTAAGYTVLNNLAQAGNQNAASIIAALGTVRASDPIATIAIGDRAGCPGCGVEYGFYRRTDKGKSISREWTGRVDYNGSNDNLYVRYTDSRNDSNPDLFANSGALQTQDTLQGGPSRLLGTMWAHTFNTHLINEFRASAQQIDFTFAPTDATAAAASAITPTISLANTMNFFWGGYAQATFPQGRGHKTFQFQDAVSYNVGRHTMKIGADLAVLLVQDHVPFNSFGLLNVSAGGTCGASTCTALQNYLDNFGGPAGTFSKSFGNPLQNVGTNQQAYYFQDSWKLMSNLTLDYGIRYEYQPFDALNSLQYPSIDRKTFATDGLLLRKQIKNDRNNLAPRFGFAYTPKFLKSVFGENKTVLRGGYGMFYDSFFTNISNNVAASSPNAIAYSRTAAQSKLVAGGRGYSNPLGMLAAAAAVASPTASISSVDSNFKNPMIHQWNLNVQRELPLQLKAEVAYVGTRGERLWINEQLNPFDPALGTRDVASRGSIVVRGNSGDSVYHGLQSTVTRSVGFLQIRGSYTYSKAIDNGSEVFVTSGGATRWQNVKDPRSDRGVSAFDRTHRAAISYNLAAPTPWKKGVLGVLTGGWQTSGVISFQSGTPETIYFGGFDQNGDGEAFNDRPTLGNPKASSLLGYSVDGGLTFADWNTDAPASKDSFKYLYIDGKNGNVARNSFRYPGSMGFDASILKDIRMPYREGHKVQLRMDLLNAFNHPNLGVSGLDGDITSDTFQDLPSTRRGGRSLLLWLKYSF